MAVHIWCPRPSDGAFKLRNALREAGVPAYKSGSRPRHVIGPFMRRIRTDDLWVNWGCGAPVTPPCRVLNANARTNKCNQLIALAAAGIPVPEVYDSPGPGRIGRSTHHSEGSDILSNTGRDYYTQRLQLIREFRIHVFNGMSIRAGVKIHRTGFTNPHEWVRSHAAGWRIDYGRANHQYLTQAMRDLAKRAVRALNLDFGAVDLGITDRGQLAVLEVNLAPGLDEGPSVAAYVRHIINVHNTR